MTTNLIEDRVKKLDTISLQHGAHNADEAGRAMCAMEAVAWIAGEPHSDHPQCASRAISAFMRSWNDGLESADRDRLLKPYLVRIVGSRGTAEQEELRGRMALDWHNGVMLPAFLDLVDGLKPHAEAVRADHLNPDVISTARSAGAAARAAAGDAAWDAARDAAWDAARDAARAAARAAARDAARDAARAALQPTVDELQISALDLLDRMLEVTA
jgi:hypothetical protein